MYLTEYFLDVKFSNRYIIKLLLRKGTSFLLDNVGFFLRKYLNFACPAEIKKEIYFISVTLCR